MTEFEFSYDIIHPNDVAMQEQFEQMKEYYRIKHDICAEVAPKVICEIGVRAGYSAWSFLHAAPGAFYVGFDSKSEGHGGQGQADFRWDLWAQGLLLPYRALLVNVDTQVWKTMGFFLRDLEVDGVDLFHVDGDHTVRGVQHDLDLALEVLADDGVILVDDIDYIRDVRDGVHRWLDRHADLAAEYRSSPRGEMLIRRS